VLCLLLTWANLHSRYPVSCTSFAFKSAVFEAAQVQLACETFVP
jgi:hypothetical protein